MAQVKPTKNILEFIITVAHTLHSKKTHRVPPMHSALNPIHHFDDANDVMEPRLVDRAKSLNQEATRTLAVGSGITAGSAQATPRETQTYCKATSESRGEVHANNFARSGRNQH